MSEQLPTTSEPEKQEASNPYEGMSRTTLDSIVEAKASIDPDSPTPGADLRAAVREKLEDSGDQAAFRRVYDMNNLELNSFVEGASGEVKERRVSELKSIIDAYDNNESFGDRRTAIREALETAGDTGAFRTVYDMNNLDLTNFVNDARHQLEDETLLDKDQALETAYSEYEEREGTPYDVDKGREKDADNARELATLEAVIKGINENPEGAKKLGIYEKLREIQKQLDEARAAELTPPEKADVDEELESPVKADLDDDKEKADDLTPPEKADLGDDLTPPEKADLGDEKADDLTPPEKADLGTGEATDEEVQELIDNPPVKADLGDDKEPTKSPWLKRAFSRLHDFYLSGVVRATNGVSNTMERFRSSDKKKVAAVVGALAVVGAFAAWRLGAFGHGGGGGGAHHEVLNNQGGGNGANHGAEVIPPVTAKPELPSADGSAYPWNWAEKVVGADKAESWLHGLGDKAAAAGHNVQWHGSGTHEWVSVDGVSRTKDVIDKLRPFANS